MISIQVGNCWTYHPLEQVTDLETIGTICVGILDLSNCKPLSITVSKDSAKIRSCAARKKPSYFFCRFTEIDHTSNLTTGKNILLRNT